YAYLTDPSYSSDFWVIRAVGAPAAVQPAPSGIAVQVSDRGVAPATRSVLAIHGVNVRGEAEFKATVATLQGTIQRPDLQLAPAFWGDLGGRPFVPELIPQDPGPAGPSATAEASHRQARYLEARSIGGKLAQAAADSRLAAAAVHQRGRDMLAASLERNLAGT